MRSFGEYAFELAVLAFEGFHGGVHGHAYFGSKRGLYDFVPPCIGRYKEYIVADIFVGFFLETLALGNEGIIAGAETVIDIFEKNKPEHHRFVFGGVEIATEFVCRIPQYLLNGL